MEERLMFSRRKPSLRDDAFAFVSKEDFKQYDELYRGAPAVFQSELQKQVDDLTAPDENTRSAQVSYGWISLNLIELCVYYDHIPARFHELVKKVIDLTYDLRWNDDRDVEVSACGFRMSMTLASIISQSFRQGSHGDWHFGAEGKSPFTETFSANEITNIERASVYQLIARCAGQKIDRRIGDVTRALHLCDQLYGNGVERLLGKKTGEEAARALAVFYRVGLGETAERILGFYTCSTGNQKKRYLQELEIWYGQTDDERRMALDRYLSDLAHQHEAYG